MKLKFFVPVALHLLNVAETLPQIKGQLRQCVLVFEDETEKVGPLDLPDLAFHRVASNRVWGGCFLLVFNVSWQYGLPCLPCWLSAV